jgi:hypothetical protein
MIGIATFKALYSRQRKSAVVVVQQNPEPLVD